MGNKQKTLSETQVEAFYHDNFVANQVNDFIKLCGPSINPTAGKIIDIGGGCGFFAKALHDLTALKLKVIDTDVQSIKVCQQAGIEALYGDALNPVIVGDENVVCFNLILHHLVGKSEDETCNLQRRALAVWQQNCHAIFVNEYIYESFVINDISGWLIFQITSNSYLSKIGRLIARVFPTLHANTFGVGVRFRSKAEWKRMFESLGFDIVGTVIGKQEGISLPRRLLFIKNCRRDSFMLKPRVINPTTTKEGDR